MCEHHCSQNIKIQPLRFTTQMEVAEKLIRILFGLHDICSLVQPVGTLQDLHMWSMQYMEMHLDCIFNKFLHKCCQIFSERIDTEHSCGQLLHPEHY